MLLILKSVEEHLKRIEILLITYARYNITINFEKPEFFRPELKFVGFILTPQGTETNTKKIEFIKEIKKPKPTLRDVLLQVLVFLQPNQCNKNYVNLVLLALFKYLKIITNCIKMYSAYSVMILTLI